jgi:Protein of unknown function (DUF4236)
MGFRFRRSISLFPGIRLNIGKRGVSTSIGVRGAHITVGHGKVRETVGIPGSGLSYSQTETTHRAAEPSNVAPTSKPGAARGLGWLLLLLVVFAAILWQSLTR